MKLKLWHNFSQFRPKKVHFFPEIDGVKFFSKKKKNQQQKTKSKKDKKNFKKKRISLVNRFKKMIFGHPHFQKQEYFF